MAALALLVRNASAVLTLAAPRGPKRGRDLADLGSEPGAAVAIRDGNVLGVGPEGAMERLLATDEVAVVDADRGLVLPGFVDPHTHLLFAGERAAEFEARLVHGRDYMAFVTEGGGGLSTVARTRATSDADLAALVRGRLDRMVRSGTTTAEVKSGYGLTVSEELRHLQVLQAVAADQPVDLVPTLLAAHFRPPEYADDPDAWLAEVDAELLPEVARRGLATAADVFCETGIYSVEQARRTLSAARAAGLAVRVHADQLSNSGGAELAVELGALSADHLGHVSEAGIAALAASSTLAVLIPGSAFFVPTEVVPPVRRMIDAGVAVAIASDCNPGSSPISSQALAIGLATVLFRISVAEAIAAATINAAHAIGVGHRAGSLEPGKQADVLVLATDDPRDLAYRFGENLVRLVIKRGELVVDRAAAGPL